MSVNFYWKAGSILGLSALALGAFGSHGLAKHVGNDPAKLRNWAFASEFQLMHGITLLVLSSIPPSIRPIHPVAKPLILGGTIAFSGTIYLLTFQREKFRALGPITPLGGLAMMAGWAALLI